MINKIILTTLVVGTLTLNGCATITSGQTQSLNVDTGQDTCAKCVLANDRGTWHVDSTPATVLVSRDIGDLTVKCNKDGKTGNAVIPSSANANALGNVILPGALLAAAIDVASGSAFDYPEEISIQLVHGDKPNNKKIV